MELAEHFGPYQLLHRLGRGGMAEVFLARTSSASGAGKLVALKRLLPGCARDRHLVQLLIDEARINAQLYHPNIVNVFDFISVDDSYGLVMEYVQGVDLRTLVPAHDRRRPLRLDVTLRVLVGLLDALDYAHKKCDQNGQPIGIVHRDVTPHNILVSRHGQPKLTDFGVARAAISSHQSRIGDIRGKFSYMPPEQAVGGKIDQRVDIFAAGAVLYELATGQQPFRAVDSARQLFLLERGVAPPSALLPTLPRELDAIVTRAMAPRAEDRFSSAQEFALELRDLMGRRYAADLSASVHRLADLVEAELQRRGDAPQVDDADLMRRQDFPSAAGFSAIAPPDEQTIRANTQAAPGLSPLTPSVDASTRSEPEPPTIAIDTLLESDTEDEPDR
jgi:serine/threonine protein kinase